MAYTQKQKLYGGLGVAAVLYLLLRGASRDEPEKKDVYVPGDTIQASPGETVVVRLPRGDYMSSSDDVSIAKENDVGSLTYLDLFVRGGGLGVDYVAEVHIIDKGDPRKTYPFRVVVRTITPGDK